ncbi:VanZ family protein [Flavobacterium sp. TMP13]|uniref:VanZ family protein n=1 Tax=unclassified Flavobacterium TaxID=196869 RepID=UPI00076D9AB9|nr:VanZ family protein [Flavobacterium sp. TAB 87]KVV14506.1 putative integral membrane protein [Flavobacterium sp. TAB 87]
MRKLIYLLLALFWTAIIAYACLMPSSNIPLVTIPLIDKIVHFTFHFGFTIIWFLYFRRQFLTPNTYKSLLMAFVFSVFFGIIIEMLQGFYTATRAQDVTDVLANTFGGTFAIITIVFYTSYISKK